MVDAFFPDLGGNGKGVVDLQDRLPVTPVTALNIRPFAEASRAIIPEGTDMVMTSGYNTRGKGGAIYVADGLVDALYVALNPRTAFISNNGRGFRLSIEQLVSPYMIGAEGSQTYNGKDTSSVPNDTVAVQAFFDFCNANRLNMANWDGAFGITDQIILGGPRGDGTTQVAEDETQCFMGHITLVPKSNIVGAALRVRARRGSYFGPITVSGGNNEVRLLWAQRLIDFGVIIEEYALGCVFSTIICYHARIAGAITPTAFFPNRLAGNDVATEYNNIFHNTLGNCHFERCGSGSQHADEFQQANYSGLGRRPAPDFGQEDSVDQRSYFVVTELPSALAEGYDMPISVKIGPEIYSVVKIDHATKTLDVYPWVNSDAASSDILLYIYGGGLVNTGGDTSMLEAKVSAQNCSSGIVDGANFHGYYYGVFQNNFFNVTIGAGPFREGSGGKLNGYFEFGAQFADVLWNKLNFNIDANFDFSGTIGFNPNTFLKFEPRRGDNSKLQFPTYGFTYHDGAYYHALENGSDGLGNFTQVGFAFDRENGRTFPIESDNPKIVLLPDPLRPYFKLFGYRAQTAHLIGSGPSGQPTGPLTVECTAPNKIDGGVAGATKTFSGFDGPVYVQISQAPNDINNFRVKFISGKSRANLRAVMQHATLGFGVQQSIPATTFTLLNLEEVDDTPAPGGFVNGTHIYTVPETGQYLCVLKVRPVEGAGPAGSSYGIGVDTAMQDSSNFVWGTLNAGRTNAQNIVTRQFNAGDQVRAFIWSEVAVNLNGAELTMRRVG